MYLLAKNNLGQHYELKFNHYVQTSQSFRTKKKELVKNYKHKFLSKFLNFHFNRQILGYKIFKSRVT